MPAEGMVHALRRAIDLVTPSGVLIDLHPTPEIAQLAIVFPDETADVIGAVHSETAVERHTNADAAVAAALTEGFVWCERADTFVFSLYCDSLDELVKYVETKWSAWFDTVTLDKATSLLRPGCRLRLSERVSISALKRRVASSERRPASDE
jgi:hypothetical protein